MDAAEKREAKIYGYLSRMKYEQRSIIDKLKGPLSQKQNTNPLRVVTKVSRNLVQFVEDNRLDILIKSKKESLKDRLDIDSKRLEILTYHVLMNSIEHGD